MEDLTKFSFTSKNFPYGELKKISDLINHEGPILSHFAFKDDKNVLYLWVDNDEINNRWLIFDVEKNDLTNYLYNELTLLDLINCSKQNFVLVSDINEKLEFTNNFLMKKENVPQSYLPSRESFFRLPIPNVYTGVSSNKEYLESLPADGIKE